jgi:hypothetical protein
MSPVFRYAGFAWVGLVFALTVNGIIYRSWSNVEGPGSATEDDVDAEQQLFDPFFYHHLTKNRMSFYSLIMFRFDLRVGFCGLHGRDLEAAPQFIHRG